MPSTASLPACLASIDPLAVPMSNILVAYATNSGSTAEVAEIIAAGLKSAGHSATTLPLNQVTTLDGYDSVVLGAPMILGWHADARRFLKQHRQALAARKVALFACAMRLTIPSGQPAQDFDLYLDPNLAAAPAKPGALTIKERFTTLGHYLKPILAAAGPVKPVNAAFFYGKLEMFRLKWWQAAFVMAVVQAPPGDYRDWDAIKAWANRLAPIL